MAIKNENAKSWFHSFKTIYLHHARRDAFTLLDPRPALLEAIVQYKYAHLYPKVKFNRELGLSIGYLNHNDICAEYDGLKAKRCPPHTRYIIILCKNNNHICHTLGEPGFYHWLFSWKRKAA
jgi:hypothetical protein